MSTIGLPQEELEAILMEGITDPAVVTAIVKAIVKNNELVQQQLNKSSNKFLTNLRLQAKNK